jgi:hypothetical protein
LPARVGISTIIKIIVYSKPSIKIGGTFDVYVPINNKHSNIDIRILLLIFIRPDL